MSRPGSAAIAAAAFLVASTLGGFDGAQAQTQGRIGGVVVEGNQRIEDSTVESYLTLRAGDRFDSRAADSSIRALFETGFFEDVRIGLRGDELVVQVEENPIVNRIAFEGNLRIDDEQLDSEVRLRPREIFTRGRVQAAVNRILELYRRNGRYAARVEPQVIELDQNRVDLVFEIEEGPLTKVSAVTFLGNERFDDARLRRVVRTEEDRWFRLFSSDDTYDPDRLALDEELLRRFYLQRGYAEFAVVSSLAELAPDGSSFFVTFVIDEGPRYDFGEVTIDSRVPDLGAAELAGAVEIEEGSVYDASQVEASIEALTERLGERGYAFAEVVPIPEVNEDERTIGLTYRIDEGSRVYVERVDISGNVRTRDEVIRREFRLSEGDPYNVTLLQASERRVRNLGFFENVEFTTRPGSSQDRIIIDVAVAEQSTGELSFGAGFSTSDGGLADIRFTERNLLGRGQLVVANFTLSQRRQNLEFSFTEPFFLGLDLAAGFDIFRTQTDFQSQSSFDETSTGGTLRASYPLTDDLRHLLRYTLRQDEISDVDDSASVFIQAEEGERITSLVGHTLIYDKRDVRFLPNEGYLLSLSQNLAGLGGDNQFLKNDLRADVYFPLLENVVLNFGAGAGYVFGWGGEDVGLANRFFLGGLSLRGFEAAGVGPRDAVTGDSLGGNIFYTGTAELRFPLGLPEELRVFGRTFVDAGNLFEIDVDGPTLSEQNGLRVGGGIGVSWLSPIGPLAIDYAKAFVEEELDETETFRVSFGTRF